MTNLCINCRNLHSKGDIIVKPDPKVSIVSDHTEDYNFCYFRQICMNNLPVRQCPQYTQRNAGTKSH
jgi:hypothetical protein